MCLYSNLLSIISKYTFFHNLYSVPRVLNVQVWIIFEILGIVLFQLMTLLIWTVVTINAVQLNPPRVYQSLHVEIPHTLTTS